MNADTLTEEGLNLATDNGTRAWLKRPSVRISDSGNYTVVETGTLLIATMSNKREVRIFVTDSSNGTRETATFTPGLASVYVPEIISGLLR